jgi:uncharacterized NAD(P)/FAD-binding protein YdhS
MEGLRPITSDLWAQADTTTRARWLRHLRPWWDVHRHRISAPVAAALARLEAEGRLRIVAGRHPVLVLRGVDVVANETTQIELDSAGNVVDPQIVKAHQQGITILRVHASQKMKRTRGFDPRNELGRLLGFRTNVPKLFLAFLFCFSRDFRLLVSPAFRIQLLTLHTVEQQKDR